MSMKWRDSILEKIGVYGWEPISLYVFSCFLSGTTPCIIGFHGSGKTMGFSRLAKSINVTSQLWDASKVTEETLGGMYNIEALKEGRQEYIKDANSSSVWGKGIGIIDELTRATPANQNALLELMYNKTFNGIKTDLILTVATANDLSYANTEPLDRAFAGRIGLVFKVPEIYNMKQATKEKVIKNSSYCDNLMLNFWSNQEHSSPEDSIDWKTVQAEVREYFQKAYYLYNQIESTYSEMFVKYVLVATEALHTKAGLGLGTKGLEDASVDARRCGMIYRNIMAGIAIESVEKELSTQELQDTIEDIWKHSFTHELTGSKLTSAMLSQAHAVAQEYIQAKNLVSVAIMKEQNPVRQLMMSIFMHDQDPIALFDICEKLFTDAFENNKSMNEEEQKNKQLLAYLLAIISKNKDGLFNTFKGKSEYAEITEKIKNIQTKAILEVLRYFDSRITELRQSEEESDAKTIQKYLDNRFCELLEMTKEEVTAKITKISSIEDVKKREREMSKFQTKAEVWVQATQLTDLALDNKTFELDPQYVFNIFEKSVEYVKETIDIIRADYSEMKKRIMMVG